MRYIGFDMGDGESAVAIFQEGSGIEPVVQLIRGSKSILSAVGRVHGQIVIGEAAYTNQLAEDLSVRFKSRFTYDPASYDTVVRFAKGILAALRESGSLKEDDVFVVGCPAGWNAACKARYLDLLVRAGIPNPRVVSESRAAFLYAKYAKTVALDIDILQKSALVVDIGSSTLDFAYIVDGRETGVGTFGEICLGGGLLDEELLRHAIEKNKHRQELAATFAQSTSWYSYAEIEARRVKEQYFARASENPDTTVQKTLRICYDGVQKLTLEMNAAEAQRLIDAPLPALNGDSFAEALARAFENARQVTADAPPHLILLTGGASRMRFLQEQCQSTFPDAVVVCCPEPEFSIAKGLSYAGWVDENMLAFRKAIAEEITDERIADLARAALPSLIPGVVDVLAQLLLDEAMLPIVSQWRSGDLNTLEDMNRRMQQRMELVMQSDLASEALSPIIALWLKGLMEQLQAMIDPICDRYQVPRKDMQLLFTQAGEASRLRIGAKELLHFQAIGATTAVILSVLGGALCGGGGIALIAVGPLGFLAGAAIGAVVAVIGWGGMSEALLKMKLPAPLRRVNVEKRLRSEAVQKSLRDAIRKEIGGTDSAFSQQTVQRFTDSLRQHLRQLAQAAEIPIQ